MARPRLGSAVLVLAAFFVFFFRDPDRTSRSDPDLVVSPADGRVMMVGEPGPGAPPGEWRQISIFLSPMDVHVNRTPVDGTRARASSIIPASSCPPTRATPGRRTNGPRCGSTISGTIVVCRQIVGILARRIVMPVDGRSAGGARRALRRDEVRLAHRPVRAARRDHLVSRPAIASWRRIDRAGARLRSAMPQSPIGSDAVSSHDEPCITARGMRHGVSLLPSLFTLANMFCGWACVVYAMRGDLATAAPFIGVAMVLDMLDGRIARMTGTTSEFGVQLDSLADMISFGMAPAVLAFAWGLRPLGRLGWAVGFLFVTARGAAPGALQHPDEHRQALLRGHGESGRRRDRASTVFYFPYGLHDRAAGLLAVLLVHRAGAADGEHHPLPQLQDHRPRRAAPVSEPDRAGRRPRAVVTYPHEVLLVMAYTYLVSGFVGSGAAQVAAVRAVRDRYAAAVNRRQCDSRPSSPDRVRSQP